MLLELDEKKRELLMEVLDSYWEENRHNATDEVVVLLANLLAALERGQ